ncbi:MAG: hypothetical protein JSW47_03080, partial [Phycisphaerales bacterium]
MFGRMSSRELLVGVLLLAAVSVVCLAEEIVEVNVNPHKIALNAQGNADDVQANVNIFLPGTRVVEFDVSLSFDGTVVAQAESAFYCVIDDILIIGFDRASLQANPDVQAMANTTVKATVSGTVTDNTGATKVFTGWDMVQIVAPG